MKTIILLVASMLLFLACSTKSIPNQDNYVVISSTCKADSCLTIFVEKGSSFSFPTFAIWIEDLDEKILETVFVTKSFATRKYGHAYKEQNQWSADSGVSIRPASLPYWFNKQFNNDKKRLYDLKPLVPDAISGATPSDNFAIKTDGNKVLPRKFRVLLEINQSWDVNDFYTTSKYLNDFEYKTSGQPSLIYAVTVDLNSPMQEYTLQPIGHGHYSGNDGLLYTDLSGFSTALDIIKKITVSVK